MSRAFEALHYRELLEPVNPAGDVGLLTLWSPLRAAKRRLQAISPEILDPARSRVAVISNLYGDGMYAMLCNLLFNPQVRHLIAVGEDLDLPTCAEIEAFLAHGLEDTQMLGLAVKRIAGTDRVFRASPEFDERRLRDGLTFRYLGKLSSPSLAAELTGSLRELPVAPQGAAEADRLRVEIPDSLPEEHSHRPSHVGAHEVTRRTPLECWEELVVRTVRFGRPVTLRSGARLELLNVKAVIAEPREESAQALRARGFSLERFRAYQAAILRAELPRDTTYTYGNRLRGHFALRDGAHDTLQSVVHALRADPETRHAYISLWDTAADLPASAGGGEDDPAGPGPGAGRRGSPCLVALAFRRSEGALALTATYRSHNLLIAWLENVYGLMAIQRHVAERAGMATGTITVISHSLGIDPRNSGYERARTLATRWRRDEDRDPESGKYSLREDPNGYFVVSADRAAGRIVAEHRYGGVLLKRYSGTRAAHIAAEIAADMSVSLVSHALWLGAELAGKERMLNVERTPDAPRPPTRREGHA